MGVACDEVEEAFEAKLERIEAVPYPKAPAKQGQGAYVLLNSQVNASYAAAFALLKDKAEMWRTKSHVKAKGVDVPAGSFVVKNSAEVKKARPAVLDKLHLAVLDLDDVAAIPMAPLKSPRIGLFPSPGAATWTRAGPALFSTTLAAPTRPSTTRTSRGRRRKRPT